MPSSTRQELQRSSRPRGARFPIRSPRFCRTWLLDFGHANHPQC
jgi:hypothetical protein